MRRPTQRGRVWAARASRLDAQEGFFIANTVQRFRGQSEERREEATVTVRVSDGSLLGPGRWQRSWRPVGVRDAFRRWTPQDLLMGEEWSDREGGIKETPAFRVQTTGTTCYSRPSPGSW